MNTSKIPLAVLAPIARRCGWDGHGNIPGEIMAYISTMSAEDAFDQYCLWFGFNGWGEKFVKTIDELRQAAGEQSQ